MTESSTTCSCQLLQNKPSLHEIKSGAEGGCQYCNVLWCSLWQLSNSNPKLSESSLYGSTVQLKGECIEVNWENGQAVCLQLFIERG